MGQHADVLLSSLDDVNAVSSCTLAKLNIICLFVIFRTFKV